MQIKFADLVSQTAEVRERVESELVKIHLNAGYIGGPHIKAFEEEFAALLSPAAKSLVAELGIRLGGYSDFVTVAGSRQPCGPLTPD